MNAQVSSFSRLRMAAPFLAMLGQRKPVANEANRVRATARRIIAACNDLLEIRYTFCSTDANESNVVLLNDDEHVSEVIDAVDVCLSVLQGSATERWATRLAKHDAPLLSQFRQAMEKSIAHLTDFRLALLFMLDESNEADDDFAIPYPAAAEPSGAVELELD